MNTPSNSNTDKNSNSQDKNLDNVHIDNDDNAKLRLRLPSAARLRGLLLKSPLSFLSIENRQSIDTDTARMNHQHYVYPQSSSNNASTSQNINTNHTNTNTNRDRATSTASDNSPSSNISHWSSQASLLSIKNTWNYAKDRVLGETESGVAFDNEEELQQKGGPLLDPAKCLPSELMVHVLGHLDSKSAINSTLVNKQWNELANGNTVWREIYLNKEHWGLADDLPPGVSWKDMYEIRRILDNRLKKGQVDPKVLIGHTDSVYCVQFDENVVITGSRDRTIRVWSTKTGQQIKKLGIGANEQADSNSSKPTICHTGSVLCLCYDSKIMISGSSDTSCIIWDMTKLKPLQQVYRHSAGVLDVCMDENFIITCSRDSTLCVWDRTDAKFSLKWRFTGHQGPVNAVHLQGKFVASAAGDCVVRLWDLTTGRCIRQFVGHTGGLACVQLCLKTRRVISGSNDNTIRIWNLDDGKCLHVLRGHKSLVRSVHLFNDKIVSGSYDQTIRIWDLHSGMEITSIDGLHGSWIFSARADAKRIITTSFGVKPVIMNFGKGLDADYLEYVR